MSYYFTTDILTFCEKKPLLGFVELINLNCKNLISEERFWN